MKLLTIALLSLSLNSMAAEKSPAISELKLRGCISLVYSNAADSKLDAKDVLKQVNQGVKSCKDQVKALVKAEKSAKQKKSLLDKIAKMQEKLQKLN
jgi:hypothetical protein